MPAVLWGQGVGQGLIVGGSMGFRRGFVVLAAAVLGSGALMPLTAHADGAVTDLYVSRASTCSDSGPGSAAVPFCSVQEAADVVDPGQTVHIGAGVYHGAVTISRSGTPDAPISFVAESGSNAESYDAVVDDSSAGAELTVSGAHDVRVTGFGVQPSAHADGIDVLGSSRIALVANAIMLNPTAPDTSAEVFVDGASSDVSITRNIGELSPGYSVHAASGAERVTVADNIFYGSDAGGVYATGVRELAVTNNSLLGILCAPEIAIDGPTSGTVENNALAATGPDGTPQCAVTPAMSVSGDAAGTVTTDYNAFYAQAPRPDYTWDGTDERTAADLAAAVPGEAAHDLDLPGGFDPQSPAPEGSPLIDSADANAPGVPALDYYGSRRSVDDPDTANTGTGAGTLDRGAAETVAQVDLAPAYSPASEVGAAPLDFTVTPHGSDTWGEPVGAMVDFGDGSGPQTVDGDSISHTYTEPGAYPVFIKATGPDGQSIVRRTTATVATTAPPTLTFTPVSATCTGGPCLFADVGQFTLSAGADAWEARKAAISFGDGHSATVYLPGSPSHTYAHAGTYTATVTATDVLGRTVTSSATVTVGEEILAENPLRIYDSRWGGQVDQVPAHGTVTLSRAQLGTDNGADGVVVNATVTNPKAGGHLVAYPYGTARPSVSLLNFSAGQTVPNLARIMGGTNGEVAFYNDSNGPIDLFVDRVGFEVGQAQYAGTYSPVGPVRVLDTRDGTGTTKGAVAANGDVILTVAGQSGVPSDAAVLLNVTTTDTKATGHLTAYAHGTTRPYTSNSNWTAGQTTADLVLVPLTDGKVVLHNASSGTADFVADLVGYYSTDRVNSVLVPSTRTRVLDTRDGTGTGGTVAKIGAKQQVRLQLAGLDGAPSAGASAAELNLTAVSPSASGYLTLYPDGSALPTASSLNYRFGHTVANAAVTPLGADGAIDVYNGGSSPVDVVIDLSGYYCVYAP